MYADDTQLKYSFLQTEINTANDLINDDLNRLVELSKHHQLSVNPLKSTALVFGKNKQQVTSSIKLTISNNDLVCTEMVKNLGLELDTTLRFRQQVTKCLKTAYANLKMVYPHRHILPQNLKIKLTDALVLSHFNYGDVVYGPCINKTDVMRIQRVQKSCLRFIYGIRKYDAISYKLNCTNWLDMENRRRLHAATLYHKIIVNKTPPYLYNKIKYRSDVHNVNIRFRGLISPPRHRTTMFRRSFSFNVYHIYNRLPLEVKHLKPRRFKSIYKKYLLDHTNTHA